MADSGNNITPWLLGGAAVFLGYKYFFKPRVVVPAHLKAYTTRIRVNVPTVRFKGDNVEFDMYVQNPNPDPLTINAIVGDVFITYGKTNMKLGNVDRYGAVTLKPFAETKYTFSVRLKLIPLVAYFNQILAGKVKNQVATFIGTIAVNGRPWPIKESVKIS